MVLDPVVIAATRTETPTTQLGAVTDVVTANDMKRMQIGSLGDVLGAATGTTGTQCGAAGAIASLFLRGANSNQTLFMVDGVRFNDPNTDYQVFLGGARLGAGDRVEIVRGPQSTLYGGEATGGVVAIGTRRGQGAATGTVSAEAGSFGTVEGTVAAQGADAEWAYSLSASAGRTDNERVNNKLARENGALRLDRAVSPTVGIGGTVRWFHSVYGDPGDRYTNDPNNRETENNLLATLFAQFNPSEQWSSRFTLGSQERRFVTETPAPNPPWSSPAATTTMRNSRFVADWQTTYRGFTGHKLTVGASAENTHTRSNGFGLIDKKQSLLAVFAQDEFSPVENVFLTAGLRSDDFDTFGRATTGRATAAWLTADKALKLRASYGTSFRSPSFLDLYGVDTYYVGNPKLRPEKSRGWDGGVDYYLPGKRGTLSATWFTTNYDDLIVYDFAVFPSTVKNAERARTSGLELSARVSLAGTELRGAYTYLEAENLTSHTRLLRRPRHAFTGDAWHDFGGGFSAGAGVTVAAGKEDVDAMTYSTINAEDFTVARLYVAWQANERLTVKARVENLLDEKYEAVNGYPSPGLAAYGGVEWKF